MSAFTVHVSKDIACHRGKVTQYGHNGNELEYNGEGSIKTLDDRDLLHSCIDLQALIY